MSSKMVIIPFDRYQRMLESKGDVVCQSVEDSYSCTDESSKTDNPAKGVQVPTRTGLSRDVILLFIPTKIRPKVETLLSLNCLDWNEKGELISDGQTIKNSHVADLLKSCFIEYKHVFEGTEALCSELASYNIPLSLITSKHIRNKVAARNRSDYTIASKNESTPQPVTTKWFTR